MKTGSFALALLLCGACGETTGQRFEVPLFAQGSGAQPVGIRGGTVTLRRAEVAFGPLYLCASKAAELELCESALAEHLATHTIDALSSRRTQLGVLAAVSGTVRGGFYDYGLSWLLTRSAPTASDGSVDGHSARFEGDVVGDAGETLSFSVDIDIAPISRGASAVHGKSEEHQLRESNDALTLQIDAQRWFARIRIEELIALDDDGDGVVTIPAGSQPYEAIVQGMTLNDLPRFVWGEP